MLGTDQEFRLNMPPAGGLVDPAMFRRLTQKQIVTIDDKALLGAEGGTITVDIPKDGLLAEIKMFVDGHLTTTDNSGAIATTNKYPHGLFKSIKLTALTTHTVFQMDGIEAHVRRLMQHPSYTDSTADFAGTVGGGDTNLGDLTADDWGLVLKLPVVHDMTSLKGLLYTQTQQQALRLVIEQAPLTDILTASGDATVDSLTGTIHFELTFFKIPIHEGANVLPNLAQLHGMFHSIVTPVAVGSPTTVPIQDINGQLLRALLRFENNAAWVQGAISEQPASINAVRLKHGASNTPFEWSNIETLLDQNNEDYGQTLPYGYVALDFIRHDHVRDAVLLTGLSDPRIELDINSGVTLASPEVRILLEVLYK